MRAVVQRVRSAEVSVDGKVVGRCGHGLLVLVAAHSKDTRQEAARMADKVWGLRVFGDEFGKMNLALKDLEPSSASAVLAISNFTLYGETSKNRRPSFMEAASFEQGRELFDAFVRELRAIGCQTETGVFGAYMQVKLVNDGPVTVILDVLPGDADATNG